FLTYAVNISPQLLRNAVVVKKTINSLFYTVIPDIRYCHCIKTIRAVRRSRIADVNVYEPSPACPHREVIVTMTDNSQRCLDPESKFTKNLLRGVEN
uniref:C-X-C motif chemokine n=1 Tax=Poecilia mexicana TaxID=48701 RepID=A0A3B3X6C8_9TELE